MLKLGHAWMLVLEKNAQAAPVAGVVGAGAVEAQARIEDVLDQRPISTKTIAVDEFPRAQGVEATRLAIGRRLSSAEMARRNQRIQTRLQHVEA